MSRFSLICSLVFGLSSVSLLTSADAQFAKAPPAATAVASSHAAAPAAPAAPAAAGANARADRARADIAPHQHLDRAAVRAALAKARATNLAAFRAYQAKGVFPSNTFDNGKLNVWLDRDGNFCAAATIIKSSGQHELANKIAEQNNFIRLADVEQGPLMDWILTSGFTQAEIAAIQEPFMSVTPEPVEPASPPIVAVDAKKRKAENARLAATYKAVDRMLVKNARKSLDKAVERLMNNPQLASQLIDAQSPRQGVDAASAVAASSSSSSSSSSS